MKLNDKQKQFVIEYIRDFNARQSAIRAGYSKRSASEIGYELLTKPHIRAAIDKALEENRCSLSRVLAELEAVAFSDITEYTMIDKDTGSIKAKPLKDIELGKTRAIESIKEDRVIKESPDGAQITVNDRFEIKLHNKLKALEMLKNYHEGGDKVKLEVVEPSEIQSSSEAMEAIRKITGE